MSRSKRFQPHIRDRWVNWNWFKSCERQKLKKLDYIPNGATYKRIVEKYDFW